MGRGSGREERKDDGIYGDVNVIMKPVTVYNTSAKKSSLEQILPDM